MLIPVFPGTNCEYDTAKAFAAAGAEPEIFVLNKRWMVARSVSDFAAKVRESQMIFIPGGFSGGDEPDGSGKLITAFFRNAEIKEAITALLGERDGLMAGICNGFQALIKLGLVPYGKIIDTDKTCPTLTYNRIGRHQSKLVRDATVSNRFSTLWQAYSQAKSIRFRFPPARAVTGIAGLRQISAANGQIITQYADFDGNATMEIQYNPNGSDWAVEGIISPDGRVLGKMGRLTYRQRALSGTCRDASTCRYSHQQSSISNKQDKSAHNAESKISMRAFLFVCGKYRAAMFI